MALLLAALQDGAALDAMPLEQLRQRTERAHTTGNPDDEHVLDVLTQADELKDLLIERVHKQYTDSGAKRLDVQLPSLRALVTEPPAWLDRYLDTVQRLRAIPSIARELPQTAELACFDALVGGGAYRAAAFDHLFTDAHRHLMLVLLNCLRAMAGERLASHVEQASELDYSRGGRTQLDRSASADETVEQSQRAALAKDDRRRT
jgi:hypothetical protein